MIDHVVKIRSSVCSQLMKSTLLKGTFLAGIGILIIVLAGIFLPLQDMTIFGLPLYALGCGLIAFGLIPYRRLTALEKSPNELWYQEIPDTPANKNEEVIYASAKGSTPESHSNSNPPLNSSTISQEIQPISRLITFRVRNKEIFTLPVDYIHSFSFVESPSKYGISICLVHPLPNKIAIYDKSYALSTLQNASSQSDNSKTLFLPYFSKRAYYQLTELVDVS